MKQLTQISICLMVACFLAVPLMSADVTYPHPSTYVPTRQEVEKHKKAFDDPRPYLTSYNLKQILPKQMYEKITWDPELMKREWANLIGFKAPDVVGKIAPEIKPGKYTYKDVQNNPAFKKLMWPDLYNRIKPGGPPHGGNIPEFEIIPTRQYYWALPIIEMTKKNAGKTKLDSKGYMVGESWEGGYPFPRPSGPFKAQQVMYNIEKRYQNFGADYTIIGRMMGHDKNLKMDMDQIWEARSIRYGGRAFLEPHGWLDKRAQDRGEAYGYMFLFHTPRESAGTVYNPIYYLDPNKMDRILLYIPSMRRVRQMTATDTQDPVQGQDQTFDDNEGFMQKLSPTRYPYKFEIIEEREFLVPAPTIDGAEYISSNNLEFRNVRMERRPLYLVQLTQLDPNYVYSRRMFYVDKETFIYYHIENYDRRNRLYRTWDGNYGWHPDVGMTSWSGMLHLMRDHIDLHCGVNQPLSLPTQWLRRDQNIEGFMKAK